MTAHMTNTAALLDEQLSFFHKNGYIGPLDVYAPDEMERIWRTVRLQSLDRSHAAYPLDGSVSETAKTNIVNYDRHLDIDLLAQHVCHPKIVGWVNSLLGPDVLCWRTEFFPKYPGDEGTDWHQADTFANASGKPQLLWPGESEDNFGAGTLTVWTAFTDSTRENGCLQLIPGTHLKMNYDETKRMDWSDNRINAEVKDGVLRGFFGYDYRQLQIDPNWKPAEEDAFPLVMKKGQCVIFSSTLMHASLPNTSIGKNYRMGFATRYVPTSVRVYPDTSQIDEYGGSISLDRWGAVLVSGQDSYGHNKVIRQTLRGKPFQPAAARLSPSGEAMDEPCLLRPTTDRGAIVNANNPDHVVIVGGGTSGWMTASYLKAAFGDRLSITVVESARIGTIGVGEATFSDIRHFFEFLQLREEDWMPACNATYKLGVRFQDWRHAGHRFYHPFEQIRSVNGFPLADWWLQNSPSDRFDADCFVMPSVCEAGRSPRFLDGSLVDRDFTGDDGITGLTMSEHQGKTQFPYAYHFEAALLAKYLTQYATDRGVRHLIDDVLDVRLDERGWIDHVITKDHGPLRGDMFVDCTGFRGLLLNQALGIPFVSYQDTLPNDSAVALQVPLDMKGRGIPPCTVATAQDNGWIWTIPLFGRIGTGYVYASDYTTPDEAERRLREFVGPEAATVDANHIRMRVGRSERSWQHNCVAIGLSSGFVEPLESTGIFFIHHAIEQLVKYFPGADWNPKNREMFNSAIAHVQDGVREFLVLHYRGAARADTQYWRDTKTRTIPDALAERIERWQAQVPDSETIYPYYHGLPPYSYMCILLGTGGIKMRPSPALSRMDGTATQKEFAAIQDRTRHLATTLPSHYEYLARMRGIDD